MKFIKIKKEDVKIGDICEWDNSTPFFKVFTIKDGRVNGTKDYKTLEEAQKATDVYDSSLAIKGSNIKSFWRYKNTLKDILE